MLFKRLEYAEPAVLRGVVTAVLALAAAVGVVVTEDVKGAAEGLIPLAAVVLPLLQALWTRARVWSPKSVDDLPGKHAADR